MLRAAGPLHVPYKHLSHSPEPITLHSPSCTCTLVQVTSLNLDYITFPLFSCIFLFLSRTQNEPLTKLLCQDLVQLNTVYSSFSCFFLSFLSKFLILYVRSIKQLNIYVTFPAPLHHKTTSGKTISYDFRPGRPGSRGHLSFSRVSRAPIFLVFLSQK